MKNLEYKKRGFQLDGRNVLYAIMIVFCVLALIEIIYGQVQKKIEKDQITLEEAQRLELQKIAEGIYVDIEDEVSLKEEVEEIQNNIANFENAELVNEQAETDSVQGQEASDHSSVAVGDEDSNLQIVLMGDSILDDRRGEDGIAEWLSWNCGAKVYNMAMGGTTAALLPDEQYDFKNWESRSLIGVVNAIVGNIDSDVFEDYHAGRVLEECDFSKTDYFIIEYGVNDFLAKIPNNRYLEDGVTRVTDEPHLYVGALEIAISELHDSFPDAKIILVSPHYCQFFSGETYVGDAYSLNYGYGPLFTYKDICTYVNGQHTVDYLLYYNTFEDSGIDAYTADEYLEDGIHLTGAGRKAYASYLSYIINKDFNPIE